MRWAFHMHQGSGARRALCQSRLTQQCVPHLAMRRWKTWYAEGRSAGASASMQASIRALTASGHSSGTRGARRRPRCGRSWHTSSCRVARDCFSYMCLGLLLMQVSAAPFHLACDPACAWPPFLLFSVLAASQLLEK